MSRQLVRRGLAIAGVAALGFGLVACGSGTSASGGTTGGSAGGSASGSAAAGAGCQKPIGVSVADQKSLFYVAAVQGMQAAADKAGCQLKITSANNNSSQQVEQVNDLLSQDIGALVFISQDSTAAAAGVRAANQSDVPVIAVDQRPESGSGELATYIATDSVKAAHQLCTWLFEQMGGSGELAILHGVLGSTAEIQRTQAAAWLGRTEPAGLVDGHPGGGPPGCPGRGFPAPGGHLDHPPAGDVRLPDRGRPFAAPGHALAGHPRRGRSGRVRHSGGP